MDQYISPLRGLDWEDTEKVQRLSSECLLALSRDQASLAAALAGLPDDPHLMALCEHYDILDKLVLWDDRSGVRIRLHIFLPGYYDRPHNHRWSYSSIILRGSYQHYLFGDPGDLGPNIDVSRLKPLMVRREVSGSTYTLHHNAIHAVVAEPYTVSLIVRGPAVKDRFLVMDRKTGASWWQYGANLEQASSALEKRMGPERLETAQRQLRAWNVLDAGDPD